MKRVVLGPLTDEDAVYARQLFKDREVGLRKNQARTREGILRQQDELATIARILGMMKIEDTDEKPPSCEFV